MSVTAPTKETRFAKKRELIVDAATRVSNEKGVAGLTFVEVAERVGLSTSSATYYFRFKEQLAAAAFEKTLNRIEALVDTAAKEADPRARVLSYVHQYFDLHHRVLCDQAQPVAILSDMRALDDAVRVPLATQYQAIFRKIRGFFGPDDDLVIRSANTARAQHLTEAMYWLPVWLHSYPFSDFERVRDRLLDLFINGLAVEGGVWEPLPVSIGIDEGVAAGHADFLRVATRLISERGYRGASVDRIAAELKVTKGSFYHHLEAKDDLVAKCFRHSYAKMAEVQKCARGDTQWQRLTSILVELLNIQLAGEWPLMRTTALQSLPGEVRSAMLARSNRTALRFAGIISDGIAEGTIRAVDPMIAGQVIMSSLNAAYELHSWAGRQSDSAQAVRLYVAPLLYGLFADGAAGT